MHKPPYRPGSASSLCGWMAVGGRGQDERAYWRVTAYWTKSKSRVQEGVGRIEAFIKRVCHDEDKHARKATVYCKLSSTNLSSGALSVSLLAEPHLLSLEVP